MEHQKSYFLFPMLPGVTMATSLSGSTRDFLKILFRMFPYNEIFEKFLKVTSDSISEIIILRYFQMPNFSQISEGI